MIDWSLKSYESMWKYLILLRHTIPDVPTDLNLEGVEFSVLPSGLHLVEQDTVYNFPLVHLLYYVLTQ